MKKQKKNRKKKRFVIDRMCVHTRFGGKRNEKNEKKKKKNDDKSPREVKKDLAIK